jgi:NitT/TauT family transport system ATP-binding protein
MIAFENVSKSFKVADAMLQAVRDVNLTVREGEFITLVGPSGCGKSTLLNMIAGMFGPTTGTVVYRGEKVSGYNRRVGYMTQSDHLLPGGMYRATSQCRSRSPECLVRTSRTELPSLSNSSA